MRKTPQLNMSSILALVAVVTSKDRANLHFLKNNDPSYSHLDWENANIWKLIIDDQLESTELHFICRKICFEFVISNEIILELARNGREALISNLTSDESQVFRNARLLEKLPDDDAVQWWDRLKILSLEKLNKSLLAQGRLAESWTIAEEKRILSEFSELTPRWVALDGDHYGYDILSFRQNTNGKIVSIQIEVKSYYSKYFPHFYLTNNEWKKASEAKNSFLYYLWCIESKEFIVLTVDNIIGHIPENKGGGGWQSVLVTLGE